jgi:hypothetical protein
VGILEPNPIIKLTEIIKPRGGIIGPRGINRTGGDY